MVKVLNVAQSQHSGNWPRNMTHSIISIPSQSAFSFGSVSTIDLKMKSIKIHELILAFNTNAITGTQAANGTYPYVASCYQWVNKLEIIVNGTVVDTLYGDHQLILQNLYNSDEDRLSTNLASGSYSNAATNRYTMSNTNGSNWYLSLKCLMNQAHFFLGTQNHEIQLRVSLNNLSNIISVGTLTGAPSMTINSVNLLARITQLDSPTNQRLLLEMQKVPKHSLFLATRYQSFILQSGITTSTSVMTAITGSVHSIYFVIRYTNAMTGAAQTSFNSIKDFSINGADGANIVGGVQLPSNLNLLIQNRHWFESTFSCEGYSGVNNSNVYTYCFSVDPASSFKNASHLSTKIMTGNEQLLINFNSALTSTAQLDIWALVEQSLEQSPSYVKLINV